MGYLYLIRHMVTDHDLYTFQVVDDKLVKDFLGINATSDLLGPVGTEIVWPELAVGSGGPDGAMGIQVTTKVPASSVWYWPSYSKLYDSRGNHVCVVQVSFGATRATVGPRNRSSSIKYT